MKEKTADEKIQPLKDLLESLGEPSPQPSDCVYCNFDLEFTGDPGRKIFKWHLDRHGMKEVTELEEWESLIRKAVETKSAIFHMYENGDGKAEMESLIAMLQLFVGDEIRKAEEKCRLSLATVEDIAKTARNNAIIDAIDEVNKHTNNTRTDIVKKLEALKK